MGNALRFLCGQCCSAPDSEAPGHHGVTSAAVGVSVLAQDLHNFQKTSQVPEGLSQHVVSSRKAQSNWYRKLSDAWNKTRTPPRTPEEASRFIIQTLKGHQKADVKGFLVFYGLPVLDGAPPPHQTSLQFELITLPVDAKAVADGDTITVYVRATDPREAPLVPKDVAAAAVQRANARSHKNYARADELHQRIIDSGYREIRVSEEEVLARKYRIRLRGIDAPESKMPFGRESKEELVKIVQGKSLRVLVFDEDRYGRCVGDVYCNGKFIQEVMLKKGLAWHYTAYDQRPELAKWEKEARAKGIGLWASKDPEMPWEWRKERRVNNKR